MEYKFLVIEVGSNNIEDFRVISRCNNVKTAFDTLKILKAENPLMVYVVSVMIGNGIV